jgi:hypothetical protein
MKQQLIEIGKALKTFAVTAAVSTAITCLTIVPIVAVCVFAVWKTFSFYWNLLN